MNYYLISWEELDGTSDADMIGALDVQWALKVAGVDPDECAWVKIERQRGMKITDEDDRREQS